MPVKLSQSRAAVICVIRMIHSKWYKKSRQSIGGSDPYGVNIKMNHLKNRHYINGKFMHSKLDSCTVSTI